MQCECAAMPECCPDPVGHCVWRQGHPSIEQHFTADSVHTLRQRMKNKALHSLLEAAEMMHKNVITSLSEISGVTSWVPGFDAGRGGRIKKCQTGDQQTQTNQCHYPAEAREELKGLRVTKVDETPGSVWVLCPVFWANLFQEHLLEATGYRIHHCHESPLQAYAEIMQLIDEKRTEYKLPNTCQRFITFRGKRVKKPPSVSLYPRGKSQEALGILKVRIVITHYGHPSTPDGKLTSRCMSLIFKEASECGDSLEIFNMLNARSPFSQAIHESRQSVHEWGALELVFVDMYPNIPKQHLLQTLREAPTAIQKFRQNRRPVIYCAVSRLDRKQDRSGTEASHDFAPVPLEAVEQYVQYELFGNAYVLVGS